MEHQISTTPISYFQPCVGWGLASRSSLHFGGRVLSRVSRAAAGDWLYINCASGITAGKSHGIWGAMRPRPEKWLKNSRPSKHQLSDSELSSESFERPGR